MYPERPRVARKSPCEMYAERGVIPGGRKSEENVLNSFVREIE